MTNVWLAHAKHLKNVFEEQRGNLAQNPDTHNYIGPSITSVWYIAWPECIQKWNNLITQNEYGVVDFVFWVIMDITIVA